MNADTDSASEENVKVIQETRPPMVRYTYVLDVSNNGQPP